jgi:3-oxoacyl-(acyl-carrier-protein) synthase
MNLLKMQGSTHWWAFADTFYTTTLAGSITKLETGINLGAAGLQMMINSHTTRRRLFTTPGIKIMNATELVPDKEMKVGDKLTMPNGFALTPKEQ